MNVAGLRMLQSRHDPARTLERLEAAILRSGFKLFGRIDHGAEAEAAGIDMRPTVLVMFGSARAGAPSVRTRQTLAIDLPLRVLIWQDEKGVTRLAYNDPAWLLGRHGAADDANVDMMNEVLANVAGEAVA